MAAQAVFLLGQVLFSAVLAAWQPRFFLVGDKITQYLPVWHWLGRQESSPGVPLVDPDQGSAGAFAADLQYGVLDPFHWLLASAVGSFHDLNLAAWALHGFAVGVLGTGTVLLARMLGASPLWSAAAALAAANSGFLLWFGAAWWPAAWGTALLPWLWWSLGTRSRWGGVVAVASSYLIATSGYPYSLPFAALVALAVLAERGWQLGTWRLWRDRGLLLSYAGAAGGLLMAAPGLLAAAGMLPASARAEAPDDPRGNAAEMIPNLLEVVVGGPTTSSLATGWWGALLPPALMATGWFVLPVLALLPWRRLAEVVRSRRPPGLVVGPVLLLAGLAATQTPTELGSLRFPIRYVVVPQVVAPVVVVALVALTGLVLTRRRALLAVLLCAGQAALALLRVPVLVEWHVLAALLGVLGVGGMLLAGRRLPRAVPVVALLATAVAPLLGVGAAVAFPSSRSGEVEAAGAPNRGMWSALQWPADIAGHRAAAVEPGLSATALVWGETGADRGLGTGVPVGSAPLYSDMRLGIGYTSVGQAGWASRWCHDFLGRSARCARPADRLLQTVPGSERPWLEVLSKDVLLVDRRAPDRVTDALAERWRPVGPAGAFQRYERVEPTPGRVTLTGADVTSVVAEQVSFESETYRVGWTAGPATQVVTRIPWWPGYRATLDGVPLEVEPVEDTVVAVRLPPGGGEGTLRIFFQRPAAAEGLLVAAAGGVVALAASLAALAGVGRPRSGRAGG